MSKKPPLSQKDLKLWKRVANTVTPMQGKSAELQALIHALADEEKKRPKGDQPDPNHPVQRKLASESDLDRLKQQGLASRPSSKTGHVLPTSAIDRKEKKRILQGRTAIDARLDLHGLTQTEAHDALFGFIRSAHRQDFKHVLVITGKGTRGQSDPYSYGSEKGILKRVVPKWLSEPAIRSLIVGFEEAHRSLGGSGALHIRLRSRNKLQKK